MIEGRGEENRGFVVDGHRTLFGEMAFVQRYERNRAGAAFIWNLMACMEGLGKHMLGLEEERVNSVGLCRDKRREKPCRCDFVGERHRALDFENKHSTVRLVS